MKHRIDYLVTGGAGFIGSNIVSRLVEMGCSVRVLDNLSTGNLGNLNSVRDRIDLIRGDMTDERVTHRAVKGVRRILHLAALPSVAKSVEDPLSTNRANVCGTLRMLVAARDEGVEKFVYSSSSSVYGDTPRLPKHELMPTCPLSPYAIQKLAGEQYCRVFHSVYGLPTVMLRYFNVYGPRQNPKSDYAAVIPLFISAVLKGKSPVIHGDGKQTRDFTFVDDVVGANILAGGSSSKANGEAFNIAGGRRISVSNLAVKIAALIDPAIRPRHDAARPGDVKHSLGDISKARRILGWKPSVTVDAGLRKTVSWFNPGATSC